MASKLDQKSLEQAFQGRVDIQEAIRAAAGIAQVLFYNMSLGFILGFPLSSETSNVRYYGFIANI